MAQPAEVVVKLRVDDTDARRKLTRLARDVDAELARLEARYTSLFVALETQLAAYGIRLEVEDE